MWDYVYWLFGRNTLSDNIIYVKNMPVFFNIKSKRKIMKPVNVHKKQCRSFIIDIREVIITTVLQADQESHY